MTEAELPDYYEILGCNRNATFQDLKKSYQRLILNSHPDKTDKKDSDETFIHIQKAWSVLKDPDTRKQYDAVLSCQEHNECLLYSTINISEMEYLKDEDIFVYPCRCGGMYMLERSDSMPSKIVIGCDECSFSIEVTGAS